MIPPEAIHVAIYRDCEVTIYRQLRGRSRYIASWSRAGYSGASMPSHWNQPRCSTSQAISP